MDSLLANYGSDDEDADSPPGSPKRVVETNRAAPAPATSLFNSLPAPKHSVADDDDWGEPIKPRNRPAEPASADQGQKNRVGSLFSALPPPKVEPVDEDWGEPIKVRNRPTELASDGQGQKKPVGSLFSALPPPKVEPVDDDWGEPIKARNRPTETETADRGQKRRVGSIFSSLPAPKVEPVDEDWGESIEERQQSTEAVSADQTQKKRDGSLFSALSSPKVETAALPSGFFDDPVGDFIAGKPSQQVFVHDGATEKKSSLSARLPPPSSSKPAFERLPPPSTSKPRKLVEFKPPINYALLEHNEEDGLERIRKRAKASEEAERATEPISGGLIAMLPKPKNSLGAGATLGSGGSQGGRRTVMETASDPYRMANEGNPNSAIVLPKVESRNMEKLEVKVERPTVEFSNSRYAIEPAVQSSEGYYPQIDGGYDSPSQQLYVHNHSGGGDGYAVSNVYDEQSWQYPEANGYGTVQAQGSTPALAEVMKRERRKGRDEPPPQMIEVKQADLTGGSKLREDEMCSTGIAFGPSYKPAASNKDKPSKLHRRKHQIGALYFDMRQNEINLLDRRAKGNLTKAETQAKYGW